MSRALQAKLKELIPFYYFQNVEALRFNETAAALLVWAAFPVSTSLDFQDGVIRHFNTDRDLFWDFQDINLRRAFVSDIHTTRSLVPALLAAHERLLEAGDSGTAAFFTADRAGLFEQLASNSTGDTLLHSLLFTEAEMVNGAAAALQDVQKTLSDLATAPTRAIGRLADFGAKFTETFNNSLTIFGNESLRTLNSLLITEASKAISPQLAGATATAMLSVLVLANQHRFQLSDFLSGDLPPRDEVALGQNVTNLT
jgi:hypothetical protein